MGHGEEFWTNVAHPGEGNGKPLSILALRTPMNCMKSKRYGTNIGYDWVTEQQLQEETVTSVCLYPVLGLTMLLHLWISFLLWILNSTQHQYFLVGLLVSREAALRQHTYLAAKLWLGIRCLTGDSSRNETKEPVHFLFSAAASADHHRNTGNTMVSYSPISSLSCLWGSRAICQGWKPSSYSSVYPPVFMDVGMSCGGSSNGILISGHS